MNKGFKTRKSSAFTNMLNRHKNYVQSYMFATMQLINTRVVNHDMDKINNDEIFDVMYENVSFTENKANEYVLVREKEFCEIMEMIRI